MPGSRDFICTEKCDKMNLGNVFCLGPALPAKRSSFGPHRSPLHTDKEEGEGRIYILRLRNREEVFSSLLDNSVLREMFLETCLHILHIEERWKKVIWWKPSMEETVLMTLTLHEFDFLTFSSSFCHSSYEQGIWYKYIVSCKAHPILLIFPLCSINVQVRKYIFGSTMPTFSCDFFFHLHCLINPQEDKTCIKF